ncbi:hypothetical protein TNCV_2219751 [Trichonephila clavipes]|nr:hypothetical protein TNCV_2219751 [Trichonephila clavipes]
MRTLDCKSYGGQGPPWLRLETSSWPKAEFQLRLRPDEFQRASFTKPQREIVGSCYRTSNGAFGRSGVPNLSPSLQPRKKWQDAQPNLKEDDIVLITKEEGPPGTWPMARVLQVHPGNDGLSELQL